uniref:Uncharacterized protein n=1 Tax=Avena sativa TaxID=4498 RepID=A0ACD5V734_AVESA
MPGTWVDTSDPPPVMVGDSLYCFLLGDSHGILEFNLGSRSPRLLPLADEEITSRAELRDMLLMMAEGGGLGLLLLSVFTVQLWKRETNCEGVASWVLGRSIALDKLLSLDSKLESPYILGFDEGNNSVFLWTSIGTFTVQLESLQLKKLCKSKSWYKYFPLNGVYTADKGIGGGHDGPELLQNA